jgi:hypothetical protein
MSSELPLPVRRSRTLRTRPLIPRIGQSFEVGRLFRLTFLHVLVGGLVLVALAALRQLHRDLDQWERVHLAPDTVI